MTSDTAVAVSMFRRDLKLAVRRWGEFANPLLFFVIVTTLVPFAVGAEPQTLARVAPGMIFIAGLLATLLALEMLWRSDYEDGSLEQLILSPHPLPLAVLAKSLAHWLVTGLPLVIVAPALAYALSLPGQAYPTLVAALLLATPTLSLPGAAASALTVSLRRGGMLIGLLVLPLTVPVLIFGVRATEMAASGESPAGPLYLLAAFLVLAITLLPLAMAAALRVSAE